MKNKVFIFTVSIFLRGQMLISVYESWIGTGCGGCTTYFLKQADFEQITNLDAAKF